MRKPPPIPNNPCRIHRFTMVERNLIGQMQKLPPSRPFIRNVFHPKPLIINNDHRFPAPFCNQSAAWMLPADKTPEACKVLVLRLWHVQQNLPPTWYITCPINQPGMTASMFHILLHVAPYIYPNKQTNLMVGPKTTTPFKTQRPAIHGHKLLGTDSAMMARLVMHCYVEGGVQVTAATTPSVSAQCSIMWGCRG